MKKIFLFTLLAFVFLLMPRANAQVTRVQLFDYLAHPDMFVNTYDTSNTCFSVNGIQATNLRISLDDSLSSNTLYTLNVTLTLTTYPSTSWFRWNSNAMSGILIGSTYVTTSPTSGSTISNQVYTGVGGTLYRKQSSLTFTFTPTNISNVWSVNIPTDTLNFSAICIDSYNLIAGGSSAAAQDIQSIINNNNINSQNELNAINNMNNSIINNQNQNTQNIIDSNKVCNIVDLEINSNTYTNFSPGYLNPSGVVVDTSSTTLFHTSNYIPIVSTGSYTLATTIGSDSYLRPYLSYCIYNSDKSLRSCSAYSSFGSSTTITGVNGYIRFSGHASFSTSLQGQSCKNGNQALSDNIDDLNNNLTNSDVDIGGHVIDAPTTSHPISSIITAPISFLQSLDDTCTPISFSLGFPGTTTKTISLPCGDTIFWNRTDLNYVQEFRLFWNVLFGGALLYFFGFKLFKAFEKALDPFETGVNDLEV